MLKFITISDFMRARGVIVDVRSQSEFAEGHIPTAFNVPLLDDAGRIEIGTLYKKEGGDSARARGLQIVRPKLQRLFESLAAALPGNLASSVRQPSAHDYDRAFEAVAADLTRSSVMSDPFVIQPPEVREFPLTLYCWRGGSRSKSLALFAHALGMNIRVIRGGHKAFRCHALEFLNQEQYPFKLCTLYGLTGAGKTKILRQWLSEGKPVIDLEALAYHRGSAFGQIGIDRFGQQVDFENHLFWEMDRLASEKVPVVVVEGESQRIGRCRLSDAFMKAMLAGYRVQVDQPVAERVRNILSDYVTPLDEARLDTEARAALDVIKKRLGGERHRELIQLLEAKNYQLFTERLLVEYYDKLYGFSRAPAEFYHAVIRNAGDWDRLPFH